MNNSIITVICFIWCTLLTCQAQDTVRLYGGYVNTNSSRFTKNVSLDLYVYFAPGSLVPDSMHVINKGSARKSEQQLLCKDVYLQKYHLDYYNSSPDGIETTAYFKDATTFFAGKNDTAKREFTALNGNNHEALLTQTILFKENPLLVVEKGKAAIINLTKEFKIWTLRFPKYYLSYVGSNYLPAGIMVNHNTGDFSIDGSILDTGFHTFRLSVEEYTHATSFYFFTVHIIDKPMPYFHIPKTQKRDSLGIPFLTATKSDSVLSYLVTYIKPGGIGQYSVNWESPEAHKKAPQLNTVKANDSTLQIELTIPIDSIGYLHSLSDDFVYIYGSEQNLPLNEILPETFSITVNTTDSQGICYNNMTSFYISRELLRLTSMNEVTNSRKNIIYPNPNSGTFTISFGDKNNQQKEIQVFDVIGNLVSQFYIKDSEATIVLPNTTKGVFFINVLTGDKHFNSKVIIE